MRGFARRLDKLEAATGRGKISEAVRAWLGQRPPLTQEEELAHRKAMEAAAPFDPSGLSARARAWLGV